MDLRERVEKAIEKIRPLLQKDGGDVEVVEIDGNVVKVRLRGQCSCCPSSIYTLKMGIEDLLKHEIPEIVRVESVTG